MNLIQQAERLKTLPDQELLAMQQRPTVIAPYLVVAEMQRRQTMRKAATAGQDPVQQTTVAQEMSSRLAGMQPPQQQMQQQQMPPAQQMRTGGVVRAQTGLAVGPNPLTNFAAQMVAGQSLPGAPLPPNLFGMALSPADMAQYGAPTDTAAELAKLRQVRGENPLAKIAEELGAEERRTRGKKQGIGEILMRLGLGMAASRRPDFLGAIGEGGIGALQGFMQNRQLTQQQADELQRRRLALLERVQGSEDVLTREAADLSRAQNAARNMQIQTVEANRRAMANQAGQQDIAAYTAAANRELQMGLNAARTQSEQQKVIAEFNNKMKELEYTRGTQLAVAAVQAKGRGGGGGGGGRGAAGEQDSFKMFTNIQKNIGEAVDYVKKLDDMLLIESDPNRKNQLIATRNQAQANAAALINSATVLRQVMNMGQTELSPSPEELMRLMGNQGNQGGKGDQQGRGTPTTPTKPRQPGSPEEPPQWLKNLFAPGVDITNSLSSLGGSFSRSGAPAIIPPKN